MHTYPRVARGAYAGRYIVGSYVRRYVYDIAGWMIFSPLLTNTGNLHRPTD